MDVSKRKDSQWRGSPRRGGGGGGGGGRSARRSDPYSRDSRPRNNDMNSGSRTTQSVSQPRQHEAVESGMTYPPPELSIRGSSGPTWVVVSNLVVGTSNEDVGLTFGAFGRVEEVKQRPMASPSHPTVTFEVAFDRKQDAQTAVDKFNGALADGRILSVTIKKAEIARDMHSQVERATAQAAAQRPRGHNLIQAPAPVPYVPNPAPAAAAAIPTAPASMRSRVKAAELVEPRARKSNAVPTGSKAGAEAKTLAARIPQPLANRLLTPAQAQKVQAEEAAKKAKQQAKAQALAASGKNTQLGKRLGGLPLAQRLLQQAGTPKSDTSTIKTAAEKKKRKRDAAKAKKATKTASMDIDA